MSDAPQGPGWWQASDGKFYPPQAPPPNKSMSGCLKWGLIIGGGLLGLLVLLIIAVAAGTSSDDGTTSTTKGQAGGTTAVSTRSGNTSHPPQDDIATQECVTDEAGFATMKGTLVNHSSKRSSYIIEVSYTAGGVQYATGTAFVNNVDPNATAEWDANSLNESRDGTTCKIVSVDRNAA